jgi:hypothetical protein
MIEAAAPEYVWLGLNTRPRAVRLPEPTQVELRELITRLDAVGIRVRTKHLRGLRTDDRHSRRT